MKNTRDTDQTVNVGLLTLDTMLKKIGHCGRFQIIFAILGILPMVPATWGIMFMTFGMYNPGWLCLDNFDLHRDGENFSLPTIAEQQNLSGQRSSMSVCDKMRTCQNLSFNSLASTIVTEWTLVCEESWVILLIITVQMTGVMLGSFVSGQVGDKLGRKYNLHGCSALLAFFNLVAIFSVSWEMYTVLRFFIGFACGGILSTANLYVSEYIPARWRAFLGAFPFWNVYTFSFSLCVFALKDWRHVHIASSCISVIAFLPVFWLPESIRFLTVHGKLQRAGKVVQKIARLNSKQVPDTSIMTTIAESEREHMKTRTSYTYRDLLHKNIRKYTIVLPMTWFIFSVGYFMTGFSLKALSGDFFVNLMLFSVLAAPMRVVALAIAIKVGRKVSASFFVFLSTVCSFALVGIQLLASEEGKVVPTVVVAFGTIMMIEAAWGVVLVLVVELFPTPVRNLAYSSCNALARLGAVVAPFLIPKENFPMFGAFLILGFLLFISFIGLLTIMETRDRPLQDNFLGTAPTKENETLNPECVS